MRSLSLISLLVAIFVSGCDPMATKRVQLQYQNPPIAGSTLTVDSPDTQAALQTLDTVLVRHGFRRLHDYPDQHEHSFIRNYALSFPTAQIAGHPYLRPSVMCHIRLTDRGLEIDLGEFGYWTSSNESKSAYSDIRATFIEKYGKSNVR
jgi:hypothetical protein